MCRHFEKLVTFLQCKWHLIQRRQIILPRHKMTLLRDHACTVVENILLANQIFRNLSRSSSPLGLWQRKFKGTFVKSFANSHLLRALVMSDELWASWQMHGYRRKRGFAQDTACTITAPATVPEDCAAYFWCLLVVRIFVRKLNSRYTFSRRKEIQLTNVPDIVSDIETSI